MFFRDVIGQEEVKQRLIQGGEKYHWPLHTHAISVAPTGVKRMPAVYVRPA